ncbi:MAG: hypothetical protein K6A35_04470 [bacterium]|nr:hypothetical protein [bacterium]
MDLEGPWQALQALSATSLHAPGRSLCRGYAWPYNHAGYILASLAAIYACGYLQPMLCAALTAFSAASMWLLVGSAGPLRAAYAFGC